ncbi:hypothetical protein N7535_009097 [Penicillium sp. DV-2018c]|nr:hypothetical protein N7461_003007 [Penicillium sp. DV-2018c]KAJ5560900.1 hypothetical protein N7535_009097 [Penicillium sp. DV-2018c]
MARVLELLRRALPDLKIVTRTDDQSQYDQLTTPWSRPYGEVHHPCAVLRPRSTEEICAIVKLLRPLHYPLAVRSGGHDFWARSTGPVKDALILDIRDIDQVEVNESNIAEIGGGANHHKVIKDLENCGRLAVTGGCPSVGYVGWACCGGYGLQSPLLGLGVDQIVGATLVNADGDTIEADENLLWGIRGAGTALGIITKLRIKTYPAQPVLAGSIAFNVEQSKQVLDRYLQLSIPRECGSYLCWVSSPEAGRMLIITLCWQGDLDEGARFGEVIRQLGSPIFSNIVAQPLSNFLDALTMLSPPIRRLSTARTQWMENLNQETQDALVQSAETLPPLCLIGIHHMHHSGTTQSELSSSFGGRSATFMLELLGSSLADDEDHSAATDAVSWVGNLWHKLREHGMRRQYPAFLSPDQDFSESYSPQDWSRLMELKSIYDSGNFFRFGIPNLAPAITHNRHEPV